MAIFEIENNDDQAHANTAFFNSDTLGQLSAPTDTDYYKFDYSQSALLGIKFAPGNDAPIKGYKIELIQNGNVLHSSINGVDFSDLTLNSLQAGTFYIAITSDSANAADFSTAPYKLTVNTKPFVTVDVEKAGNDVIGGATSINVGLGTKQALIKSPFDSTRILGNLSSASDKDYFKFQADQPGMYRIDFAPGTTKIDPDEDQHFYKVSVIQSVNGVETVLSSYLLDKSSVNLNFSAPTTGVYYLLVENGGSVINVNTEQYEIKINPVDADANSPTTDGGSLRDYLTGTVQNEVFNGNAGNDYIFSKGGNDSIDGGLGNDTMVGGVGNDIYVVSSSDDKVIESLNEGTDEVHSDISYTLSANLEILKLNEVTTAKNATGNAKDNILIGNNLNNSLSGKEGNDSLDGGTSTGGDSLSGGIGNDYYVINSIKDKITEHPPEVVANAGSSDTAFTKVSGYVLADNVEFLFLDESAVVIDATGNGGNNNIVGNSFHNNLYGAGGNDTIAAGAGNDALIGGDGNDKLTGGTGADVFVFNTTLNASSNVDIITDFSGHADNLSGSFSEDSIFLSLSIFTKLSAFGTAGDNIPDANFFVGTIANAGADDYIIYDQSSGFLYYDANGKPGGNDKTNPIHFATLSDENGLHADLHADDFVFA